MARCLEHGAQTTLILIAVLTFMFAPLQTDLRVGKVNQLLLGMVASLIWLRRTSNRPAFDVLAGFVLAVAVLFKPVLAGIPLLLSILWLIDGRLGIWLRACAGFAAGVLAVVLSTTVVFVSIHCWWQWMNLLPMLSSPPYAVVSGNYGLSQVVREATGWNIGPILFGLCVLTVGTAFWLTRRPGIDNESIRADLNPAFREEFLVIGAGCIVVLISAPLAWLHYYLLAAPLLIYGFGPAQPTDWGRPRQLIMRRILALLALMAVAESPLVFFLAVTNHHLLALLTAAGCIALLVLALWELIALRASRLRHPAGQTKTRAPLASTATNVGRV